MEAQLGDLLELAHLTPQQAVLLRRQLRIQLERTRPDAVALVDGFGHSDRKVRAGQCPHGRFIQSTLQHSILSSCEAQLC